MRGPRTALAYSPILNVSTAFAKIIYFYIDHEACIVRGLPAVHVPGGPRDRGARAGTPARDAGLRPVGVALGRRTAETER